MGSSTASDDSMIEVAVTSCSGRLGTICARRDHSVNDLKEMIQFATDIPAEHQLLKFGRQFLKPHEQPFATLERATAALFLHEAPHASDTVESTFIGMAGDLGSFNTCRFSTLADMRDMLESNVQIPKAESLQLVINDTIFHDPSDQPLATLDSDEATIFVVVSTRAEKKSISEINKTIKDIQTRIS
eukprot:TRINITY_DN2623_c0_g1_i1.p1 TRINITY_DN2623_c0_g1~~TRINITY_DN2623_c0_g1_i1.p1  ORF type:complete len:187 (+),score=23.06 TRINITY_DN2623_c0_g1_i1:119-679(+)